MDHDAFKASIDRWYRAASQDEDWTGALTASARALEAEGLAVRSTHPSGRPPTLRASAGASESFLRACRRAPQRSAPDLGARADWESAGTEDGAVLLIAAWADGDDRARCVHELMLRAPADIPEAALQDLLDTARRATAVARNVSALRSTAELQSKALDQLPFGVAQIDATLRVVAFNEAFASLLQRADGLTCLGGRLICHDPRDLAALVAALALGAEESEGAPPNLRVTRPHGAPPYAVRVLAPGENAPPCRADMRLLIILDPDSAPPHDSELWRIIYGLTDCEIAIAEGIIAGKRMKEIARARQVSVETIRTQAKRLYERLDVRTQAEAAAQLCRAAPFLSTDAPLLTSAGRRSAALAA